MFAKSSAEDVEGMSISGFTVMAERFPVFLAIGPLMEGVAAAVDTGVVILWTLGAGAVLCIFLCVCA